MLDVGGAGGTMSLLFPSAMVPPERLPTGIVEDVLHTIFREYPEFAKSIVSTNSMGPKLIVRICNERAGRLRALLDGLGSIEVRGVDASGCEDAHGERQLTFDFLREPRPRNGGNGM